MLDPASLIDFDPARWQALRASRPVLVHRVEGYVDAGSVGHGVAAHLLDELDSEVVARFDLDQIIDYRSRRPVLTFDTNQWVGVAELELALHRVTDTEGRDFLLLAGPEPDAQWNRCIAAVLLIADALDVSMLATVSGIPMGVPHTRPVLVTGSSTDAALVPDNPVWIDRIQVPGGFSSLLEFRAGQAGRLARGFVAHVPHYLAQGTYTPGVLALLSHLSAATGLALPEGDLAATAAANRQALEAEIAGESELSTLIAALEEQYDSLQASGRPSVPSADEIGAAVEQFLAERDDEGGAR